MVNNSLFTRIKKRDCMKKVGLFFGGLSNEAGVSITSAKNIANNFDYQKYKLILVFWDKRDSRFYIVESFEKLKDNSRIRITIEELGKKIDVALLMTHGRYGEDGILQSILESQKIKYSGCRVLSSAVCMDKAMFKGLLIGTNIKQVRYQVLDYKQNIKIELEHKLREIRKDFSLPIYVKPANSGSSIGITKIDNFKQLKVGINEALKYDTKVVVEEGLVSAREIEVAILGNDKLIVSSPGELKLVKDFYNYDDKYKRGQTQSIIPAKLSNKKMKEIQTLAKKAYHLYNCQGFARVDFFLHNNKVYLNEINTLPGFTDISMYPMLMVKKGIKYKELINRIINLAY